MDFVTWDPATIDRVVALLAPLSPFGTEHRIRPRLLAGEVLNAVTEVVEDEDGHPIGVVHLADDPIFPSNVDVALAVHPSHRGRGLGPALAARALELLRTRNRGRRPLVVLREELEDGRRFAERCGFHVASRSVGWEAPLPAGTAATHRNALAQLSSEQHVDVTVVTLQTHGEQIASVSERATTGLPRVSGEEDEIDASAAWAYFFSPNSSILLATIGREPVGVSVLAPVEGSTSWYIEFTGVDPAARGRGVARALKHSQFMVAADAGGTEIVTYNEEHNTPILNLNRSFGLTRRPGYTGLTL
ncbi:hypothetical protein DEI92_00870 [Curtobacterium sp. MCBD17_034]|uniref:GNAT family N-acetyltransferase n=1 Tax=unclassified Curtobacterium TaxID=257496 RepID=UPI000DA77B3A|nr:MULTISPECIES: GNAT family N-acetyltransferase [unclassified Curtobacterium]PZF62101.1 hypothetical protein DEI92_00870 [Curtobacterium sp. MCBD17_034]PZM33965.1 hypothetical protein DEI90_09825 [Curtobacterium sp. MCBD17_031]